MPKALIIFVVAATVPGFFLLMWVVSSYNRMAYLRDRFKHAYAQLDRLLSRRNELIFRLPSSASKEQLASLEQEIGFLRQVYNEAVGAYNAEREKFPAHFIAGFFHFHQAEPFVIGDHGKMEMPRAKP